MGLDRLRCCPANRLTESRELKPLWKKATGRDGWDPSLAFLSSVNSDNEEKSSEAKKRWCKWGFIFCVLLPMGIVWPGESFEHGEENAAGLTCQGVDLRSVAPYRGRKWGTSYIFNPEVVTLHQFTPSLPSHQESFHGPTFHRTYDRKILKRP